MSDFDDLDDLIELLGGLADPNHAMPELPARVAERRRQIRRRRAVERGGMVLAVVAVGVLGVTAINGGDDADVVTRTPTAESTVPETASTSTPTPELISGAVDAPVPYIAAVLEDHSLVLLDAATGAEIREIHSSPERQPMVDGVLAIGADGTVYFTTTTGECGEVHTEHIGGGPERQLLPTSRAVLSSDGGFRAIRDSGPGCDDGPWTVESVGDADVPVDVLLNRNGIALVVWSEGSNVRVARASDLDQLPLSISGRAEAGTWPDLAVEEPDGGHVLLNLLTGEHRPLPDQLGTVLGVAAGHLLTLSDDGELARLSPTGASRIVATGVLDAAWGPVEDGGSPAIRMALPPVDQVVVLRTDGSVEVIDAIDGRTWYPVEVVRAEGSRVLDLLAVDLRGVLLTTDEGECGTLRIAGYPPSDSIMLETSRVVMSPDGSVVAARDPADGCEDGPWVLMGAAGGTVRLDHPVDGLAVTGDDSVAVLWNDGGRVRWRHIVTGDEESRLIDVPIDDFGVGWADPQFALGGVGDWPNLVVTSESPVVPGEFAHGWVNASTGDVSRVHGGTNRVVAAHAGHLLVLDSKGELRRVDSDGTEQILADGVLDATWGPMPANDNYAVLPIVVEPIALSGAPGDPIDIEIPGLPRYGVVYFTLPEEPNSGAHLGEISGDPFHPRLSTAIPWSFGRFEPIQPGRYSLRWATYEYTPIVIGSIEITAPGRMPSPAGAIAGAAPVLRADGLGELAYGTSRDDTVTYLQQLLVSSPVADAETSEALRFGRLTVLFDGSAGFVGWRYRQHSDEWPLLSTVEGIRIGSNVADLTAAFPSSIFTSCGDGHTSGVWYALGAPWTVATDANPGYMAFLSADVGQISASVVELSASIDGRGDEC